MVVVVEVPIVGEVIPGGGLVSVASGSARFFVLVCFGLVLQDLGDDPAMGFGGNKDLREYQWSRGPSPLLTLVLLDSP